MKASPPELGSIWRHYNGCEYEVIAITNQDSTNKKYLPTVVYKGKNGKVWSRFLHDWHKSMEKSRYQTIDMLKRKIANCGNHTELAFVRDTVYKKNIAGELHTNEGFWLEFNGAIFNRRNVLNKH